MSLDRRDSQAGKSLALGRLRIVMDDGIEFDLKTGEVSTLPSGHDAWVAGDEPAVLVDWYGEVITRRVSLPGSAAYSSTR